MDKMVEILPFYKDKRVLITGHTGFKGSWLCKILTLAGSKVTGYALKPPTQPNLFDLCDYHDRLDSTIGDIRDAKALHECFVKAKPDIVFHLAAQPLVRDSYERPVYTYETNVMGTVNILEEVRKSDYVKSVVNVTTDKVYLNNEWVWGYRETEPLDGYDPYSNSKSCSELVTHSYKKSYFDPAGLSVSTARAGNVIGGGDYAANRIIPDCIRAAISGEEIIVRNPHSTRPYQHVLESLGGYLLIAMRQYTDFDISGYYNVGPDDGDCVSTGYLADVFCASWGEGQAWKNVSEGNIHEANFLKLDCSKIKYVLGWQPKWDIRNAVEKTVEWAKGCRDGHNINDIMIRQINEYFND